MFSRRDLLMGIPIAAAAPAARDLSPMDLAPLASAVRSLQHLTPSSDIDQINERRRLHFRVYQKFPAYIDVGLGVWERLVTWNLENHLQLTIKRSLDGHMEMDYMFTSLVLKWESADTLIGVPYD
jgi:hypothetical protein